MPKKIVIVTLVLTVLLITYLNLPFNYKYYSEISLGNEYIGSINAYQDSTGKLPETSDWKVLKPLMPDDMKNEWSPEYNKIDSVNFELVYPSGFDGPYLRYCSFDKEWSEGFSCNMK